MIGLEWLCDLGTGFVAPAELLTGNFATRVDNYDATVHLPSVPANASAGSYLAGPQIWDGREPSEEWGMVHQARGERPLGVVVKRLLLSAEVAESDAEIQEAAQSIVDATEAWRDGLRTWLEVVTGQHLTDIGHREVRVIGQKTPIWQVSPDQSDRRPLTTPGVTPITLGRTVPAVTADVLAGCLSLASNRAPELAWTLLRDARSLSKARQYRRAVIDAATAAELAITSMLDTRLNEVEEPVREALLASNRMLTRKKGLMKSLGCRPLPERLKKDLEDPRNKAVHEGVHISGAESHAAISVAADVVEMAYPLPCPPGSHRPLRRLWT